MEPVSHDCEQYADATGIDARCCADVLLQQAANNPGSEQDQTEAAQVFGKCVAGGQFNAPALSLG